MTASVARLNITTRPTTRRTSAGGQRLRLRLRDQACPQTQPAGEQQRQQGGQRHDAQPADLDAEQDHGLPEPRPVGAGVHGHQTGDADRRRRVEQRRQEVGPPRPGGGDRQRQQPGADRDGGSERGGDHPPRVPESPGRAGSAGPAVQRLAHRGPACGLRPGRGLARPSGPVERRFPCTRSAADVDAGAARRVRLDLADDLPHDRWGVAAAEQQVAEQVPEGVALGPLEVAVRSDAGGVAQGQQDRRDGVRGGRGCRPAGPGGRRPRRRARAAPR